MSKKTDKQILKKVLSLGWERWVGRDHTPFVISLFDGGITPRQFHDAGVPGLTMEAFLFQDRRWYKSDKVFAKMAPAFAKFLTRHRVRELTRQLANVRQRELRNLEKLLKSDWSVERQLREAHRIIGEAMAYVWLAHGLEHYLLPKLKKEVAKLVPTDEVDRVVGDLSLPTRPNEHGLMELAIRRRDRPEKIVEQYGWIKARELVDGRPYTVADIKKIAAKLRREKNILRHPTMRIPARLKTMIADARELVFLRTQRTDVIYELLFRTRPIWQKVARYYGISWRDFPDYTVQSLEAGRSQAYPDHFAGAAYHGKLYFFNRQIIDEERAGKTTSLRGTTASPGVARGRVKIVHTTRDLGKVKNGDVLITEMTFPSYIMAMKRAAAFVTNEGGLTCHAAIIARELHKPCVIGTKFATDVFKDGDRVEVDATKGVVKKI